MDCRRSRAAGPQSASAQTLPDVEIDDAPAFAWRDIMLDVSRHFYDVPTVERFIDLASHYKLNTFHWHLSDEQGWRVQINRYPRLTEIGSCRAGSEVGKNPRRRRGSALLRLLHASADTRGRRIRR